MTKLTAKEIANSWQGKFHFNKETGNSPGLRSPQIGALHALMAHVEDGEDRAIVVMPTGTGKTETMLAFLIANVCEKVFVIVPSDALRSQTNKKFKELGLLPKLLRTGDRSLSCKSTFCPRTSDMPFIIEQYLNRPTASSSLKSTRMSTSLSSRSSPLENEPNSHARSTGCVARYCCIFGMMSVCVRVFIIVSFVCSRCEDTHFFTLHCFEKAKSSLLSKRCRYVLPPTPCPHQH